MKTATSKEFEARLVLLLVLVLVAFTPPGYTNSTDPKSAIEQVLQTQQEAWNRHDLEPFMASDWNSPDLTFFSDAKRDQRLASPQPVSQPAKLPSLMPASVFLCVLCGRRIQPDGDKTLCGV